MPAISLGWGLGRAPKSRPSDSQAPSLPYDVVQLLSLFRSLVFSWRGWNAKTTRMTLATWTMRRPELLLAGLKVIVILCCLYASLFVLKFGAPFVKTLQILSLSLLKGRGRPFRWLTALDCKCR